MKNFAKFIGKQLFQSLFPEPEVCNFIKKETLAQVFSFELCEIFKNTYITAHVTATTSADYFQAELDLTDAFSGDLETSKTKIC